MKLFIYVGVNELMLVRAADAEGAARLFLARYPRHLADNAAASGLTGRTLPTDLAQLVAAFEAISPDGPPDIVLDFAGYDGGF